VLENETANQIIETLNDLAPQLAALDTRYRLPLIELSIPALKMLIAPEREAFKRDLKKLITANNRVESWEWALYRIFTLALSKPEPSRAVYSSVRRIAEECRIVLAVVSYTDTETGESAEEAFAHAADELGLNTAPPDKNRIQGAQFDRALKKIRRLKPLKKPAFLKALCAAVEHDGVVTAREVELVRAVAETIDCPMPPLSVSQ
jgi:hypothetical protein